MLKSTVTFCTLLFVLFLPTAGIAEAPLAPSVSINQGLFFMSLAGEPVQLEPGTYQVTQGKTESHLMLVKDGGSVQILAERIEHEGELSSPIALIVPENDQEQRITLLLPNGGGFEAIGSFSGIQERGIQGNVRKTSGVSKALQTLRPASKSSGSTANPVKTTGLLPAAQKPSPQLQQLNQGGGSSPSLKPRAVGELLNIIRTLPGGREAIESAKKRGARISFLKPKNENSLLSWLNPFDVSPAFAQGQFAVGLTQHNSMVGPHHLSFDRVSLRKDSSVALYSNSNSRAYLWIQVPTTGWYIVAFEAESNYKVQALLKHNDPDKNWMTNEAAPPVQTWTYQQSQQAMARTYPALVELEAGFHEFRFSLAQGSVTFLAVSVQSL